MAANANEQNDLDAAEGLAYLNRIALQELPINREDEEMQRIAVNGPFVNPTSSHDSFPLEAKLIERFYWIVSIVRSEKVFINSYLARMFAKLCVWVIKIE